MPEGIFLESKIFFQVFLFLFSIKYSFLKNRAQPSRPARKLHAATVPYRDAASAAAARLFAFACVRAGRDGVPALSQKGVAPRASRAPAQRCLRLLPLDSRNTDTRTGPGATAAPANRRAKEATMRIPKPSCISPATRRRPNAAAPASPAGRTRADRCRPLPGKSLAESIRPAAGRW
jgi:hypothetical protein